MSRIVSNVILFVLMSLLYGCKAIGVGYGNQTLVILPEQESVFLGI